MTSTQTDMVEEILDTHRAVLERLRACAGSPWTHLDLTMAQLKTLFVLEHEGSATIGQIATCLGISLPTASHLVDRLVQAELAERAEDPADRRRTITCLAPAGHELTTQLRQGGREHLRGWLIQLDTQDLQALQQGLQALLHVARQDDAGR